MNKDEALKMAIEQLEAEIFPPLNKAFVIAKLKQALEQPAQEPVAWYGKDTAFPKANKIFVFNNKTDANAYGMRKSVSISPLYPHPHQWQGLTDDEVTKLWAKFEIKLVGCDIRDWTRVIEQSLKDKNT
jgi:hypothetical protein